MTDLCEIEIVGDYRSIDKDTFEAISGRIEVKVTYNGTTISKELDVAITDRSGDFPIALVGVAAIVLITILAAILLFIRKRGDRKKEE
jgi:hypothetical protein